MKKRSGFSSLSLVKLGLSNHETKVYQTLLEEGSLSAKEIGKKVGILSNAVYRLLAKLINKGFVSVGDKHPSIYRALSPSITFESLAKRKILEIEELKDKAIDELTKKRIKAQPTQVNLLTSRYEIMTTYAQMAKESKKEILIISIGESVPDEVILANRDALAKGIKIKMIAHKYDQENKNLLEAWQKMGMKIRHFPDWGFHLIVFDGKKSLLAVNNPKDTRERIGMQIFSEDLSKAFRDYFYSVWEKATKI